MTRSRIAGDYDTTKALHEPYMENVLDFLRRATRHLIRVFPTFGDGEVPHERIVGAVKAIDAEMLVAEV